MKKAVVILLVLAAAAGGYVFFTRTDSTAAGAGVDPGRPAAAAGGGAFARPPMTVELAKVSRAPVAEQLLVVGNLIGEATVEVVPKVGGRLQAVHVRLGDAVRRGQVLAEVEDREILEQVKQAEASNSVGEATIRQREADLKFAETALERSRSLFERQLLPRQSMDDADARHQAAAAQLDLARAQFEQTKARLEELRINLANTKITSPVDGFVAKRTLDPGAYANTNTPVVAVVDISEVRLVVNLVEKDLRRIRAGVAAVAEVDAFPGESFKGRVARVAPVLDPATRTAEIEIEIPNAKFRLKPGMYSRVNLTIEERQNALVVPRNALVDIEGKHGVFVPGEGSTAKFQPVEIGLQDEARVEVKSGIAEGATIITTGASALRDGDTVILPGQGERGAPGGPGPPGRGPGGGNTTAGPPAPQGPRNQ